MDTQFYCIIILQFWTNAMGQIHLICSSKEGTNAVSPKRFFLILVFLSHSKPFYFSFRDIFYIYDRTYLEISQYWRTSETLLSHKHSAFLGKQTNKGIFSFILLQSIESIFFTRPSLCLFYRLQCL